MGLMLVVMFSLTNFIILHMLYNLVENYIFIIMQFVDWEEDKEEKIGLEEDSNDPTSSVIRAVK